MSLLFTTQVYLFVHLFILSQLNSSQNPDQLLGFHWKYIYSFTPIGFFLVNVYWVGVGVCVYVCVHECTHSQLHMCYSIMLLKLRGEPQVLFSILFTSRYLE